MIGEKLNPVLCELEETLWILEGNGTKPNYSNEAFRAATKIFMSCLMDKMYDLQLEENIDEENKIKMVQKAGEDLRKFIKTYTNLDTHDFYKDLN